VTRRKIAAARNHPKTMLIMSSSYRNSFVKRVPELDMGSIRRQDFTGWLPVAGCASNQGLLHDRFDADVLLSVPRGYFLQPH
jgi:hypothetical protein